MKVELDYSAFETFKHYCKNNEINVVNSEYKEDIVCKIELEDSKKEKLIKDFETKKVNIKKLEELSKKFITKSI